MKDALLKCLLDKILIKDVDHDCLKCPYTKDKCIEFDYSTASLLKECKDCKHYDNGIVASKF